MGLFVSNKKKIALSESYALSFNASNLYFSEHEPFKWNIKTRQIGGTYSLVWDGTRWFFPIQIALNTRVMRGTDLNVRLKRAPLPEEEIAREIEPFCVYFKPRISDLFLVGKGIILVKGTFLFLPGKHGWDAEYPYFALIFPQKDNVLVKDCYALLRVLFIDNRYYLVTHFGKEGSCARGVIIYRLEEEGLVEAFVYYKAKEVINSCLV